MLHNWRVINCLRIYHLFALSFVAVAYLSAVAGRDDKRELSSPAEQNAHIFQLSGSQQPVQIINYLQNNVAEVAMNAFGSGTTWIVLVQLFQMVFGGKFNVSSEDLDHCLHYIVEDGYTYKKFFKIRPDMQHSRDPNDTVHLKLYVYASKDVHILLANSVNPPFNESVYEIVLDAGGDTFSEIRNRLRSSPLVTRRLANIIEAEEVTPIVIRVTRAGQITVQVGNETYLQAFDKHLTPVQYLSFASWRKATWIAYFDCHSNKKSADGDGDELEAVYEQLSTRDKLKNKLLYKYNADVSPDQLHRVSTVLRIDHVDYLADKSTLLTRVGLRMEWVDPKLRWNTDEFEDIGSVALVEKREPSIWTPDIFLINARDDQFIALPLALTAIAGSTGNVTVHSKPTQLRTRCATIGASLHGQWPFDVLTCDIQLTAMDPHIRLAAHAGQFLQIGDLETSESTGWHLMQVQLLNGSSSSGAPVTNDTADKAEESDESTATTTADLVYRLTLRRNSLFLVAVFVAPLFVVHALLWASFWCGPQSPISRVSLCSLALIATALVLLVSGEYTPRSYVPQLIRYYEITLYMAWFACVLFVIDRRLAVDSDGQWRRDGASGATVEAEEGDSGGVVGRLSRFLQSPWLRMALCMDTDFSYDRIYKSDNNAMRLDVRTIVDRLAFATYAALAAIGWAVGI